MALCLRGKTQIGVLGEKAAGDQSLICVIMI